MSNKIKKIVAGTLLATSALTVVGCSSSTAPADKSQETTTEVAPKTETPSQIIAFGDSASDNGNANRVSIELVDAAVEGAYIKPGDLYWENRYSDGKTAIEVAADTLGVPLQNYAVGGATTGIDNYSAWMDTNENTGVLGQIERFKESLGGENAEDEALYFIFAGGNDYFRHTDFKVGENAEVIADEAIANYETAVRNLVELGADEFLIPTALDVSLLPYEINENRVDYAKGFVDKLNGELPAVFEKLEEELDIEIHSFDMTGLMGDMSQNPSNYGFTETQKPAQPTWPEVLPKVENPEEYMFFDEWHFTGTTHKAIGEKMAEAIKQF